jgi:hypothetical protein
MFCFGIDGVNEIINVPSYKYHKHLIFLVLQVFKNLSAVCGAAGGDLNDIVKLNIFLTDLSHFPTVNEIMAQYFSVQIPQAFNFSCAFGPNPLIEIIGSDNSIIARFALFIQDRLL